MRVEPLTAMSKLTHRSIRIGVALALAGVLILVGSGRAFGFVGLEQTSPYSCAPTFCYGANEWSNRPPYLGVYVDIQVVHLHCDGSCASNGMINNEVWLADDRKVGNHCQNASPNWCWVEVGYMMHHGSQNEIFFWYDKRPSADPAYELLSVVGPPPTPVPASPTVFIVAPRPAPTLPTSPTVPVGDYGQKYHFIIISGGRAQPNSFVVFLYNDNLSVVYKGVSSSNSMIAQKVDIGQELHGTDGASAEQATFTQNYYATQELGTDNKFWYKVQNQKGTPLGDMNAPQGNWDVYPDVSGDGGRFSTQCC